MAWGLFKAIKTVFLEVVTGIPAILVFGRLSDTSRLPRKFKYYVERDDVQQLFGRQEDPEDPCEYIKNSFFAQISDESLRQAALSYADTQLRPLLLQSTEDISQENAIDVIFKLALHFLSSWVARRCYHKETVAVGGTNVSLVTRVLQLIRSVDIINGENVRLVESMVFLHASAHYGKPLSLTLLSHQAQSVPEFSQLNTTRILRVAHACNDRQAIMFVTLAKLIHERDFTKMDYGVRWNEDDELDTSFEEVKRLIALSDDDDDSHRHLMTVLHFLLASPNNERFIDWVMSSGIVWDVFRNCLCLAWRFYVVNAIMFLLLVLSIFAFRCMSLAFFASRCLAPLCNNAEGAETAEDPVRRPSPGRGISPTRPGRIVP